MWFNDIYHSDGLNNTLLSQACNFEVAPDVEE